MRLGIFLIFVCVGVGLIWQAGAESGWVSYATAGFGALLILLGVAFLLSSGAEERQ